LDIKHALRRQVRAETDALDDGYIEESNNGIFFNVINMEQFTNANSLMIYYSIDREPDTLRIAETALSMGKTVAFPYCYLGGKMEARAVKALDELVPAMLKIPAPAKSSAYVSPDALDLIIVPALTYDKDGYRLGYGGGYYDRYLEKLSAFTIGIARDKLLCDALPREAHDIAVSCLVTESSIKIF